MPSFLSKIVAHSTPLRVVRRGVAACIWLALAFPAQARPSSTHSSTHSDRARRATLQYRHAETLRQHLLAEAPRRRAASQYNSVLNTYRAVYHGDPASAEAPKSIFAVAELLEIEGRQFHRAKDFHDAIAQYEFLRRQYPASPLRATAQWAEADIAHRDLHSRPIHDRRMTARLDRASSHQDAPRAPRAARPTAVSESASNTDAPLSSDANSLDAPVSEAAANSMARVLGLRIHRIVIDAGHGGHDSGTLGPYGLEEKNVVLDVALRLGRLLRERLGAEVIYTRKDDTFVPLATRTAIANQARADLFLSIHANSSPDADARGVETYFLNFTASPDALAVAARENAVANHSVYELSDMVRKIALSDKIGESRALATDVQQSLYQGLERGNRGVNRGLRNRGVKQAPFVVLIGAHMPSILTEISFLTNASDAAELRRPAYRQRIAESIYSGVAAYVESMGGVRIAENTNITDR
jgi:N-acetylmuramoyl-L-alanine amidase